MASFNEGESKQDSECNLQWIRGRGFASICAVLSLFLQVGLERRHRSSEEDLSSSALQVIFGEQSISFGTRSFLFFESLMSVVAKNAVHES